MNAGGWPADAVERRPVASLVPYARNARTHSEAQVAQLAASIRQFGWTIPVLVDESGVIIAGHGRVMAAQLLGLTDVPVMVARGWTEAQCRAYTIADNQLPLGASWDMGLLSAELQELDTGEVDLQTLGFADGELERILTWTPDGTQRASETADDEKANAIPAASPVVVTRPGDLWTMGDHRLLCGDCRRAGDVECVLERDRINVAVTSPPYAEQREYDEASGFRPVPPERYVEWFAPVSANIARALEDDGSFFLNIKPCADGLDTSLYVFDLVATHVREWGWHFATEFCWERNGVPKQVTLRFKNQFEPVYQLTRNRWKFRPEAVRHASSNVPKAGGPGVGATTWSTKQGGNGEFFGGARRRANGTGSQGSGQDAGEYIGEGLAYPGNRLPTFAGSHTALGHTAAFPVGLPEFFIRAYSDEGDIVFEPFCGSGSTIIAAQRTGRRARAIELSPEYVDIAVRRWQDFTGQRATLAGDGRTFEELSHARAEAKADVA